MASGGYRPGGGRPKGSRDLPKSVVPKTRTKKPGKFAISAELAARIESQASVTPLEYMLAVVNDPGADITRRDRMAIAAAPFVHARADAKPLGKKEVAAEAAMTAGAGTGWGNDLGEAASLN